MQVYKFPGCEVWVWEDYLETRFPDGTKVLAVGNDDEASVTLAESLGYKSTWEMSRDHEIAHTWLAVLQGYEYSPTLWRVAHGQSLDHDWVRREEFSVLEWQRAYPKERVRPWEFNSVHPPT